jgi:hypothetical protein
MCVRERSPRSQKPIDKTSGRIARVKRKKKGGKKEEKEYEYEYRTGNVYKQ